MVKKLLAVRVVLGLSAIFLSNCASAPSTAEIGRPAPNFTLEDLDGRKISLDQFKGKIVMLDFWATWCGPCRMTMPVAEELQKEYSDIMVLLAVNLQESNDTVVAYLREEGINPLVLLDQQGSVGMMYGADGIPLQVLIDQEGIVRYMQMGVAPPSRIRLQIESLR